MEDICVTSQDNLEIASFEASKICSVLVGMGSEAVPMLVEIVKDKGKDWVTRCLSLQLLGRIKDGSAVEPIISILENSSENAQARMFSAISLGMIGDKRALSGLRNVVRDNDKNVKRASISAIGHLKDDRAVQCLLDVLYDSDQLAQVRAIKSLGEIGAKSASGALLRKLLYEEDAFLTTKDDKSQPTIHKIYSKIVRMNTIAVLGELKTREAVPILMEILENKEEEANVRKASATALSNIGDRRAIEPLIKILYDENEGIRVYSAEALAELGYVKAIPHMESILAEIKDKHIRNRITKALNILKTQK